MAEAYGSWATIQNRRRVRAYLSQSQTNYGTYTRISLGAHCNCDLIAKYGVRCVIGVDDGGWSTGNTGVCASGSNVAGTSRTYDVTRGQSAKTLKVYGKVYGEAVSGYGAFTGGESTATITVTIPALESHTVSYNANGGTGAPGKQTKWYGTVLTLSSTVPTRTGYTFLGWATSSTGSVAYAAGGTYTGDSALTLYAVWSELTYTVSFDANGGTGAPAAQTKQYTQSLILSSTAPTRDLYDFLGWATQASATTAEYQAGGTITANADTVLYAVWKLAWVAPTIANITCYRSLADGTASDEGTCASVSFDWSTFSELYPSTRVWASCNGTEIEGEAGGLSGSFAGMFGGLDLETTYTVTMSVSDTNNTNTRTATVQPMDFLLDFAPGGGVGIGGIAPNGARRLSVQMDGMELANPDTDDLLIAADTAANTYQLGTASGMSLAGSPTALTVTDGGSQVAGLTAAKATLDTADGLAMAGGRTIADSDGLCVPYCKTLYVQESGHGVGYEPSFDPTPYDMIEVYYRYGGGVDDAYAYGSPQLGSVRLVLDDPGLPVHFTLQGMFQATSATWQLLCEKKILTSEGIRNNGYGKFINSGSSEVKTGSNSGYGFTTLRVVGWTWA